MHGDPRIAIAPPGSLPVVVAWIGERLGAEGPDHADVVVGPEDIGDLRSVVEHAPLAATALVVLLRGQPDRDVDAGLAAESAVYSLLQAGPEFARWHTARGRCAPCRAPDADAEVVRTQRTGDVLEIALARAHRHNAITTRLRDQLHAALMVPRLDDSITQVHLRGHGPSFCSGGDLDEFGMRPDVATAHAVRLARNPGRAIHSLRDRTTAHIHGAALGGGIELAAFAGRVVADPATFIGLPELTLGLVPGAGGTVSVTRRIGRQRTAALALTARRIDASTALAWGLVDHVDHVGRP